MSIEGHHIAFHPRLCAHSAGAWRDHDRHAENCEYPLRHDWLQLFHETMKNGDYLHSQSYYGRNSLWAFSVWRVFRPEPQCTGFEHATVLPLAVGNGFRSSTNRYERLALLEIRSYCPGGSLKLSSRKQRFWIKGLHVDKEESSFSMGVARGRCWNFGGRLVPVFHRHGP